MVDYSVTSLSMSESEKFRHGFFCSAGLFQQVLEFIYTLDSLNVTLRAIACLSACLPSNKYWHKKVYLNWICVALYHAVKQQGMN